MRIGLVNPPCEYEADPANRDLCHLGGIVNIEASLRNKYDIKTVNFSHDKNASLDDLADCDVVGFTSFIDSYRFFNKTLPELKRQGKKLVVGGALISSYGLTPKNILMQEFPEIDYGVIGEGEITIVNLIRSLEGKRELPSGLIYRDKGELKVTGPTEIVHNLDELPQIDYSKWLGFSEAVRGRILNTQQISRGCHNKCHFCFRISEEHGVRSFSLSRIEKELEKMAELKPRRIFFSDDTFTYNRERAIGVGKLTKKFGFKYGFETRVSDVDADLMKKLRDTGCTHVMFGIESFDENLVRKVGKNVTKEQMYNAIKVTQKFGIEAIGFFIVGLPGENKETLKTTIKGIEETRVLPRARLLIPLPGTKIYQDLVREGKINEVELLKKFSEPGYDDTKFGDWVPINLSEDLTDQELLEARNKMHVLREELSK